MPVYLKPFDDLLRRYYETDRKDYVLIARQDPLKT